MAEDTVLDRFLNKNFSESDYKDTPWIRNLIETRNLISVLSKQRDRHSKKVDELKKKYDDAMEDIFNQMTPLGKISDNLKDNLLDVIYLQDSMILNLVRVILEIHHSAKVDYLKEERKQKEYSREKARQKSVKLLKENKREEDDELTKILNEELGITDEDEDEEEDGGENSEQEEKEKE